MTLRAMREGQPSRALPEYLTKEIFSSRILVTVQGGVPMTVKEMEPVPVVSQKSRHRLFLRVSFGHSLWKM